MSLFARQLMTLDGYVAFQALHAYWPALAISGRLMISCTVYVIAFKWELFPSHSDSSSESHTCRLCSCSLHVFDFSVRTAW